MAIKAEYQNYLKSARCLRLMGQSVVEIRFGESGSLAAVSPQVYLTSLEVASGRVNYGGRIVLSVAYVDDDGTLCRKQKGAEFSHYIDNDTLVPNNIGQCQLSVKKTTVRREGSSVVVAVVIESEIYVFSKTERRYLSAIEGAFSKTEKIEIYNNIPVYGESEIEDEFDCVAGDILLSQAKAVVISTAARGGYIEVEGEIYLNILAVRDKQPISLDRIIPFKSEIGLDESDSSSTAVAFAEIKEVTIDAKVVEDKGTCDAFFNATLAISGCLIKKDTIEVVVDAFSVDNDLVAEYASESFLGEIESKVYTERVLGLSSTKAKIDYTCAFKACVLPDVDFALTERGIAGAVVATLIYEQSGELMSTEVTLPFEIFLSGCDMQSSDVSVAVSGISIRQKEEGECECQASLKICCQVMPERSVNYMVDASEGEAISAEEAAISVCMPKKGESLFEIGKALKISPDEIQKTNPDIKFPLTGDERIIVYRNKTR